MSCSAKTRMNPGQQIELLHFPLHQGDYHNSCKALNPKLQSTYRLSDPEMNHREFSFGRGKEGKEIRKHLSELRFSGRIKQQCFILSNPHGLAHMTAPPHQQWYSHLACTTSPASITSCQPPHFPLVHWTTDPATPVPLAFFAHWKFHLFWVHSYSTCRIK